MDFKTLEVHIIRLDGRNTKESFFREDLDRTIKDLKAYEKNSNDLQLVISVDDRPAKIKPTTKLSKIARNATKLTIIYRKKTKPTH